MDKSFVSIGAGLNVKEAINRSLPYLLDANQQLFEIDSDSTPRLIHLKVSRSNGQFPWGCSIRNAKLSDIAKFYDKDAAEFDPPRIVNGQTGIVMGPMMPMLEPIPKPPFMRGGTLDKIYLKGGNTNPWDAGPLPDFKFYFQMYDVAENDPINGVTYPTSLRMEGEQRYRTHQLAEIGTYIIPICYHRTTDKGFETIQVLRSDASFWPMPIHQVWSMQDNWQDLWRDPDAGFDPGRYNYDSP